MHPYFFPCSSRFSILMDMVVMFLILHLTPHRWSILRMGSSMQLLILIIIKVTGNWLAFDLWPLCSLIDICLFVSIRWIRTRRQPRHSAGASSWRHRWCCTRDVGWRCDRIGPRLSIFCILVCLREPLLTSHVVLTLPLHLILRRFNNVAGLGVRSLSFLYSSLYQSLCTFD